MRSKIFAADKKSILKFFLFFQKKFYLEIFFHSLVKKNFSNRTLEIFCTNKKFIYNFLYRRSLKFFFKHRDEKIFYVYKKFYSLIIFFYNDEKVFHDRAKLFM